MHARGQTSIEVLLVVSFVLVVVLAIVIPYVENQSITNAAYVAKLSILPFIEKNNSNVKINHVIPEVVSGDITLHVTTSGTWDRAVNLELLLGLNGLPSGCRQVCNEVKALGSYSTVSIDWVHSGTTYCGGLVSC